MQNSIKNILLFYSLKLLKMSAPNLSESPFGALKSSSKIFTFEVSKIFLKCLCKHSPLFIRKSLFRIENSRRQISWKVYVFEENDFKRDILKSPRVWPRFRSIVLKNDIFMRQNILLKHILKRRYIKKVVFLSRSP